MQFLIWLAGFFFIGVQAQNKVQSRDLFLRNNSNILVSFTGSQDLVYQSISYRRFSTRGERILALKNGLQSLCRINHEEAIRGIVGFGLEPVSLWLTNQVYVKGATPEVVAFLSNLPSVRRIEEEKVFVSGPVTLQAVRTPRFNQWGLDNIKARNVWNAVNGSMGEGVVIGIIDSGVRADHKDLIENFVGVEYGWRDFTENEQTPVDADGHGTHITGTTCGRNGIGVAPESQWMHCRACFTNAEGRTTCPGNAVTRCAQWMLCPTKPDGTDEDCSRAPDVVSNSWGGGQGENWYNSNVRAWETAGIFHVFSIGNSGPNCSTAHSPGDQNGAFSVCATDQEDYVAEFSSRGPAVETGNIVPSICAPGVMILGASHTSNDSYVYMSGTSMAAPHVAGAAALIISGVGPGRITPGQVRQAMISTAERNLPRVGQTCGGIPEDEFPNNISGWGRLDVERAYMLLTGS